MSKQLDRPLLVCCSKINHTSLFILVRTWTKLKTQILPKDVSTVLLSFSLCWREFSRNVHYLPSVSLITWCHKTGWNVFHISLPMQILADGCVGIPGFSVFTLIQWEEVAVCCPSLFMSKETFVHQRMDIQCVQYLYILCLTALNNNVKSNFIENMTETKKAPNIVPYLITRPFIYTEF